MSKGCTQLQNIQLLKWCRGFGITPYWNLLFGFPGEDPCWFDEQARIIPRLSHLKAPSMLCAVRLDRFSPYFCEAEAHGITNVRPARALCYVYPLPEAELHGLAYHFDFDFADGRDPARYMGPLLEAARRWRRIEDEAFLYALPWNDGLLLWDEREPEAGGHRLLNPRMRRLYEFCDRVRSRQEIRSFAGQALEMPEAEAADALHEWTEAGLVIVEGDQLLALAVLVEEAGLRVLDHDATAQEAGPRAAPPSARPLRRAGLRSLALPQGTIVLDRARGRALVLSGLAAEIWARADGERSLATLARQVSAREPAAPSPPGRVVRGTLTALVAEDLIRLEGAAGERSLAAT